MSVIYILFSDCVKVKEKEKIDLLFDGGHWAYYALKKNTFLD